MAAGEYVSVSSQSDTEQADLSRERAELAANGEFERNELASIYVRRGLQPKLAQQVAAQLMAHDALTTHVATSLEFPKSRQRDQLKRRSRQPPPLPSALQFPC